MEGQKIFVGNYKGGVGKTTSIYQLALHMAELEKKVLLIDLDPQCSLSEICLARIDRNLDTLEPEECLNYVYDLWNQFKQYPQLDFTINIDTLIKQTKENIHFIPSNIFYKNGGLDELAITLSDEFEDLMILQQFFKASSLATEYDYILFDCPPSNNVITQGAFLLSDYYIIPSIIQTMSVRGVVHYIKTVEKIYNKYCEDHEQAMLARLLLGTKPQLIGIFETLKKGTIKNDEILTNLKDDLTKAGVSSILSKNAGKFIFNTIIKNYEDIARSTAEGSKSSEYADLTDEILDCLEQPTYI